MLSLCWGGSFVPWTEVYTIRIDNKILLYFNFSTCFITYNYHNQVGSVGLYPGSFGYESAADPVVEQHVQQRLPAGKYCHDTWTVVMSKNSSEWHIWRAIYRCYHCYCPVRQKHGVLKLELLEVLRLTEPQGQLVQLDRLMHLNQV